MSDSTAADLIITGGPILTMDADDSRVDAVAIRDGRIVAAGSSDEVTTHRGAATELLNLDGRALLPGLIDPHMHAAMVQMADWVDVSPMTNPSADDVYTTLRNATPTSTGWVIAKLYDPSITDGDPHLDRDVLDRLIPHHPALVFESNGHIAYVNSAAMREAGVDRDSPDPPQARYGRDSDGELTGRLEESAAVGAFTKGIPPLTHDDLVSRHRDPCCTTAPSAPSAVVMTSTSCAASSPATPRCGTAACSCPLCTTPGTAWA